MQKLKAGYKALIEAAEREIETLDVAAARALLGNEDVVFVDLRDIRELTREGRIPGSFHAPRGMLEFWVDPESPYHKEVFSKGHRLVFYCQSGWRSALATQAVQAMGLERVCHVGGGFIAWKQSGAPVESVPDKR
jgi:rhodanese-related sulfurtransferase